MANKSLIKGSVSGVLGLGFEEHAKPNGTSILRALVQDDRLPSPVMSFSFSRTQNIVTTADTKEPSGTFTLGGTNPSLYTGEIEYLPVEASGSWSLQLSSAFFMRRT
jgi:cathepsin D